ncbi:MAG TPA: hypothetical protein VGY98_02005 [Verrucomicrobiae bacterium]|nr:hypothetical protein [Verrucomicrobiae bacterium]
MSLLNDALKRASLSQQQQDAVRLNLPPAIVPAEPLAVAETPGRGPGWAVPVVIILLVVVALGFGVLAHLSGKRRAHMATVVSVPPPVRAVPAAPKPTPRPVAKPIAAVAATAPAVRMPRLRVQGITYYNAKWQAIVNGHTVYVGDDVYGFRVAMISRNRVSFIAPDGSKKTITLGE